MLSFHVIGSRLSGGAERFYMRLVHALHRRGEQVVAVSRAGSSVSAELDPAIRQLHAPLANMWDLYSRWKIGRAVRRERPAIVQTYMSRATELTHLPAGKGVIHVARLGGYYALKHFRHAHAWIGNTKDLCDYMIQGGLASKRVFYLGNFVDLPAPTDPERLAALRTALEIPEDGLVVLGVGRINLRKGFADLLDAFGRLPAQIRGRPLHLVIVGDGPMCRELVEQTWQQAWGARVHWAGWQNDPDPYYALADLFVCPSRHEPLGNVILEAWAHGKAVVSTDTVGARELMTDGVNGWVVPCEDPAAMARAIARALEDEAARREMGRAGRDFVATKYTQDAIVQEYLALYAHLTGCG